VSRTYEGRAENGLKEGRIEQRRRNNGEQV
jgi:hypothetical protein